MADVTYDNSKGSNESTVKTNGGATVRAMNAVVVEGDVTYDNSKSSTQSTIKTKDGKTVRAVNVNVVAGSAGGGGGDLPDNIVVNNATGLNAIAILGEAAGEGCVGIGNKARAGAAGSVAIGNDASASNNAVLAIGRQAIATHQTSIQIGPGTTTKANTLFIGLGGSNYDLLDGDGHIPDERLPQLGDISKLLDDINGEEVE